MRSAQGKRGAALLVPAMVAVAATLCATAAGAGSGSKIVLYSVTTEEQFVNNADDRQRGQGNNPFGNYKDTTATTKEKGNGPFPGDVAVFAFDLYSNTSLKKPVGSATFTCQYNFKKNAYCAATYTLSGGTLIGGGTLNFSAPTFAIAITGGTGRFRGKLGDVEAGPVAKNHAQPITIRLG